MPYLRSVTGIAARKAQIERTERNFRAGGTYALAHVLFLSGGSGTTEFAKVMEELERAYPEYAPVRFLKGEIRDLAAMTPTLIRSENFLMLDDSGKRVEIEISAVKVRIGEERAAVVFVDNRNRKIFGQKYIDAEKNALEDSVSRYAEEVLANLKGGYQREATLAERKGRSFPPADATLRKIQDIITSRTGGA